MPATRTLTIVNSRGLHARAAAKFVEVATAHNAAVTVTRAGQTVSATSIMGLMMLAAATGSTIDLTADGPDAVAALDALAELVAAKFGED